MTTTCPMCGHTTNYMIATGGGTVDWYCFACYARWERNPDLQPPRKRGVIATLTMREKDDGEI